MKSRLERNAFQSLLLLAGVALLMVSQISSAQINLGSVNVGSKTAATITVSVANAATLSGVAVLTQGAPGRDFTSFGGTCMIGKTYAAKATCTVEVKFAPTTSGARYGAVVLRDSSASPDVVTTVYLEGIGLGLQEPVAVFWPGQVSAIAGPFPNAGGLAVDGNANIYVADRGAYDGIEWVVNPTIHQLSLISGTYTYNQIGSGFGAPQGVAVDGSGNVYVADSGFYYEGVFTGPVSIPAGLYKETLQADGSFVQSTIGSFVGPWSVAVDGRGNVYVGDSGNGTVTRESPLGDGSYVGVPIGSGWTRPIGIAVDGAGNVYVTNDAGGTPGDPASGGLFKETLEANASYVQSAIGSGLDGAIGEVAVDGGGNLYIVDNGMVKENLQPDGSYLQSWAKGLPPGLFGVAVDQTGNILATDGGDAGYWAPGEDTVWEIAPALAPSLGFAETGVFSFSTDSPQTVGIANAGSAPLQFSGIIFPKDFPQWRAQKNPCTAETSLARGESCNLTVAFKPIEALGSNTTLTLNERVIVTTDTRNSAGSEISIPVSGTETLLTAGAPVFTVASGTYDGSIQVRIEDATPGATISYAVYSSSTGRWNGATYTGPFLVSESEVVKAIATASGYLQSPAVTETYIIKQPVSAPTFSPAPGVYGSAQTISLGDRYYAGIVFYYTTDGTAPTGSSKVFPAAGINVTGTETLKAIAIAPGFSQSPVTTATYTIEPPTPAPVFSLKSGLYTSVQTMQVTDAVTSGISVYYTADGSTPTTASTRYTSAGIKVGSTETVKAIAQAVGGWTSAVTSANYTIHLPLDAPVLSLKPGSYTGAQMVTVTDKSPDALLFYTTNGNAPTASSTRYSGPIAISETTTLKVIALATGYPASAVVTAILTIQ